MHRQYELYAISNISLQRSALIDSHSSSRRHLQSTLAIICLATPLKRCVTCDVGDACSTTCLHRCEAAAWPCGCMLLQSNKGLAAKSSSNFMALVYLYKQLHACTPNPASSVTAFLMIIGRFHQSSALRCNLASLLDLTLKLTRQLV